MTRAMEYAKESGFDSVSSSLAVSRHKSPEQVVMAGARASAATGVAYDVRALRLPGRRRLIAELGLYRQNYCGCKPREE